MLKYYRALTLFEILKVSLIFYVLLLLYIEENISTNGGKEQHVVPTTLIKNSTEVLEMFYQFLITLLEFVPKDEYFVKPLSTVHQSPLMDCDVRVQLDEPTCVTMLSIFLTSVLFAFAYFTSQMISDARHLFSGSSTGILVATTMACIITKVVHFDRVRQDWWYLYPVLAHFAALATSFWTVVLLRADLFGCLNRLEQNARYRNFALLPPADMSSLIYPCVCTLGSLAVVPFFKASFANHELECVRFCWLADSSLYVSLYTPVVVFALFSLVLFHTTISDLQSFHHTTDETVRTVYSAYCNHFVIFVMLCSFWCLGAAFSVVGHKTLWHLLVTSSVLVAVGWSLVDFFGEGLSSIFVSPFTFDMNNLANTYFDPELIDCDVELLM